MSLKNVYYKLLQIKNVDSKIDKINLLREFLTDSDFKTVVELALNPYKKYKISNIVNNGQYNNVDNKILFDKLNQLAKQKGVSDNDKKELLSLISDNETFNVVYFILNKTLNCGVSIKTINKIIPDFIPDVKYMRCSSIKKLKNITYPAILQEKANGMFVNIIVESDNIIFLNRKFNEIYQLDSLYNEVLKLQLQNVVLHGELLVLNNNILLDRKDGNKILIKCMNNNLNNINGYQIIVKLWDIVDLDDFYKGISNITYINRFHRLQTILNSYNGNNIYLIYTYIVDNIFDVKKIYEDIISKGKEGCILKNKNSIWKNYTSPDLIKLKNEGECELRIVDWKKGKKNTKYENCLGALICKTDDNLIKVSVGVGFSDDEREINWNRYIGAIVTVSFEHIIKDEKHDTYSLYLPVFVELRYDKTTTNTYNEILEIQNKFDVEKIINKYLK